MRKKGKYIFLISLCAILSLSGCRKKAAETETETETETATTETETESESETEKQSETKKTSSTTSSKTTSSTEKTVVKPTSSSSSSTSSSSTSSSSTSSSSASTTSTQTTATTEASSSYGTAQCPYCYQQISLEPNSDGTTVYSAHVAQEKAWAEYVGTSTSTTETSSTSSSTETSSTSSSSDTAQCGYCYQWFSVSDGSYSTHVAQEQAALGISGTDTTMVVCPTCGNSFTKEMFSYHVCTAGN